MKERKRFGYGNTHTQKEGESYKNRAKRLE